MKKRMLSLILAAVLVCALLPVTAMAAEITVSEAIPYKYDDARDFSEGLASVKLNDKWGYIDKTGREVIPCKYESAWSFSEGLAPVELNGKWGFIDKTGKEVIPCKYDQVRDFSEGLAVVYLSGKWGYIDKTGREVVPFGKYDSMEKFSEGFGLVRNRVNSHSEVGFIDKTGKEVIPLKYGHAFPFSEGLAAVRGFADKDWKWGFIDKTGKEIIPHKYEMVVDGFSEGFAKVTETSSGKSQWGYIDKTGKEVIPCKYDQVRDFSEGLAAVCDGQWPNGKWGFIDKTGKVVIPFQYDGVSLSGFSEGLARVYGENGLGFIDKTGREVVPVGKYTDARDFSEGMVAVKPLRGKWGFLAIDGYVNLELDQGSGTDYIIADSSNILNVPTNPTKEGYTFGGWYTDAALTIPWNFNNKVVNTLALYAKWVPVSSTASKTGKNQSTISLNGKNVTLDAYTLKAANGGDVTYVKLRDVAALLENTSVKFNVDWKRGAIYVASKSAYTTKNGTELKAISGTDGSYKWNQAPVLFDGTTKALEGIVLTDGKGGGHTFFKLRDLGEALGFTVGWSAERGIFIETK